MKSSRAVVVASLFVLGSSMRVAGAQPPPPPPPTDNANENPPTGAQPPVGPDDTDPTALTEFRSTLDPYGTWVNDDTYGTVWIPNESVVGSDFVPYESAGSWVSQNGGYVWQSDYPWGEAVFHHGRWVSIPSRGWAWIPGRAYSDAWVDWRVDDGSGYVGWAPTPPAWIWTGGVAVTLGFVPFVPFVFCPPRELFLAPHERHVIVGPRAAELHAQSRPFAVPGHGYGPNYARPYVPPARAPLLNVGPRAYVAPRPDAVPRPFIAPRPSIVAPRPIVAPPPVVAPHSIVVPHSFEAPHTVAPPPAMRAPAMPMPAPRAPTPSFTRHR